MFSPDCEMVRFHGCFRYRCMPFASVSFPSYQRITILRPPDQFPPFPFPQKRNVILMQDGKHSVKGWKINPELIPASKLPVNPPQQSFPQIGQLIVGEKLDVHG